MVPNPGKVAVQRKLRVEQLWFRPRVLDSLRLGLVGLFMLLLSGAVQVSADPTITWTPSAVVETVVQGEAKTRMVSFTSSEDLSDVAAKIAPALQPYVRATPSVFPSIRAGHVVTITLTLSAPADAPLETLHGALRLRKTTKPRQTFAKRLPITLTILPASVPPAWVEQGPGPTLDGQTEGLPNNPVAGAINAIAASPTDPDLVFVATVNGGIWRTTNATAASPAWTPLTDQQFPALSTRSLAISPVDPHTLFAGTGTTSSFGFDGSLDIASPGFGVARSTDGGDTWTVLAASTLAGQEINSIVPTTLDGGNVVLAATLFSVVGLGGVFRSTDMGNSFTQVSGNGTSGLPASGVSSLVADPGNPARFYAAVPGQGFSPPGTEGVYRSDDGGVTWTAMNTGLTDLNALRILLSVHNNATLGTNAIYAAILGGNSIFPGVFRSDNGGATWTALGVPAPTIFPGFSIFVHGALVAHPTDPHVVFVSGDRQDLPNPNGCSNFTGNTFRGDASLLPGNPWTSVDCNGAHGTSPHADARAMVFDANGDLLRADDGGIYRLVDPNNEAGVRQWVSVNGDIRPTEFHSVAYDPLSHIVFGGTQDTGTPIQSAPGSFTWTELLQGDGGKVAVDSDQAAHPGTTIRYTSFQFFGFFNRTTWDAANTLVSGPTPVQLRITSGPGTGQTLSQFDRNIGFYQPFVLNAIDPSRMLIGTTFLYESLDRGDSLANLGDTGFSINLFLSGSPMAYGGRLNGEPNPDVFYVASGPLILHRVTLGGPITTLSTPDPGSAAVRGLVIDPQNYQTIYAVDVRDQPPRSSRVWASFDEGVSWMNLTANLLSLSNSPDSIRAIEVISPDGTAEHTVLIVGGLDGVFQMRSPGAADASWTVLSGGLPHGLVLDLHHNATNDVVVAGILGRGAWTLTGFFQGTGTTVVAQRGARSQPREPAAGGFDLDLPVMPPAPVPARGDLSQE